MSWTPILLKGILNKKQGQYQRIQPWLDANVLPLSFSARETVIKTARLKRGASCTVRVVHSKYRIRMSMPNIARYRKNPFASILAWEILTPCQPCQYLIWLNPATWELTRETPSYLFFFTNVNNVYAAFLCHVLVSLVGFKLRLWRRPLNAGRSSQYSETPFILPGGQMLLAAQRTESMCEPMAKMQRSQQGVNRLCRTLCNSKGI